MLESVVAVAVAVVGLELADGGVVVVAGMELEGGGVPPHHLHHLVARDRLVRLNDLRIFHLANQRRFQTFGLELV